MVTFRQLLHFRLFAAGSESSQGLAFWLADFMARRFAAAPAAGARGQTLFRTPFVRVEEVAADAERITLSLAGPAAAYADLSCRGLRIAPGPGGVTRLTLTNRGALDAACRAVERGRAHLAGSFPWVRLERVINRGQPGIEAEAIRTARLFGVPTGGRTHRSVKWLHSSGVKPARPGRRLLTKHVGRHADGTLILTSRPTAPKGLKGRPVILIAPRALPDPAGVARWMERHDVRILHVTGGRHDAGKAAGFLFRLFTFLQLRWQPPPDGPDPRSPGYHLHAAGGRVWCAALWPDLRVWRRDGHGGNWVRDDGFDPLSGGSVAAAGPDAGFWRSVPADVRAWVGRFDASPLRLLRGCARHGPPLSDLAGAGALTLAYLLACSGLPVRIGDRPLAYMPRREIAGRLGLPGTESMVRLLGRIPPASCTPDLGCFLARLLSSESAFTQLRRLKRVNHGVLTIMGEYHLRRLSTQRLLEEVAMDPAEDVHRRHGGTPELLQEIGREAVVRDAARRLRPLRDRRDARQFLEELRRLPMPVPSRTADPAPPRPLAPLAGIPGVIEPLTGKADLEAEGAAMHHCVARCLPQVTARTSLLFRLLPCPDRGTERATLEVVAGLGSAGHRVAQVRGVRNRPVSAGTTRFVEEWLRAAADVPGLPVQFPGPYAGVEQTNMTGPRRPNPEAPLYDAVTARPDPIPALWPDVGAPRGKEPGGRTCFQT